MKFDAMESRAVKAREDGRTRAVQICRKRKLRWNTHLFASLRSATFDDTLS